MKWIFSGSLVTVAIAGGVFAVRHFTTMPEPIPVPYSYSLPGSYSANQLAGEYYFGGGSNNYLKLLKNHQFTYRLVGCMGEYARLKGTWEQNNEVVILAPSDPVEQAESELNLRFIPVSWGECLYLIDENQMPGFCAGIQQREFAMFEGGYSSRDYVRLTGNKIPGVQGELEIPARYKDFLERGEMTAKVTSVDADGYVSLIESATPRMTPGMLLSLNDFGYIPDFIVVSIDRGRVRAKPILLPEQKMDSIQPGNIFTTGSYWHRPEGTHSSAH